MNPLVNPIHGDMHMTQIFANVQLNTNALLSMKHAKMDLSLTQSGNALASLKVKLMISLPQLRLLEKIAFLEHQTTMRTMSVTMTAQQDSLITLSFVAALLKIHLA